MKLNDPNFINFDGAPVTGRVPPQMRVEGGRELTQQQLGAVMHAYKLFRDALKVSVTSFLVQNRTLADGTRVRMESMLDRDVVYVWPTGGGGNEGKLPHGFAVVTNWRAPKIYKRRLTWPSEELQWKFASDAVPQVKQGEVTFDNQVFRKPVGKPFFNLPLVLRRAKKILWDYAQRAGLSTPTAGDTVPVRIKDSTTGAFTLRAPHYASENKVMSTAGGVLYTVADEAPILSPSAEGYPDPITYFPGATDAAGNRLAMNAWRRAVWSPSANIWKFRLWNERIKRVSDTGYEALERNVQDITTPWSKQTVGVTSVSDSALGENPDDLLYAVTMSTAGQDGVGPVGGTNGAVTWLTGFVDYEIDISGITRRNSFMNSKRQIVTQAAGSETLAKVVAVGVHDEVVYIDILKELNYPADILWRGGEAGVGVFVTDFAFVTAYTSQYGTSNAILYRKDTKYYVDGVPKVTAKLRWKDLLLLEGTTQGRMDGKVYSDVETIFSSFQHKTYDYIVREVYQTSNPAGAHYVAPGPPFSAWLNDGKNIRNTYYADLMVDHGVTPFDGPNASPKTTVLENTRPFNTVAYSLKSRYVIDYDHKGRFYAAIRCEVECSGAEWEENTAVYEGFMQVKTNPSYTVRIYFESEWNGVFAQQLLVEESITRPGFEIITIEKFSPWYWPFPAYTDRSCLARVPPEPVPDERFMNQLKTLSSNQGANTNLCCADVRPDITGADVALTQSQGGIEYSYLRGEQVVPHKKYVTGQLYARTFKLSDADISDSMWMLYQLKCSAVEGNFQPPDPAPIKPSWFYHPVIKAALEVTRHIEVRDGIIVQWSDNLPGETTGYPPTPAAPPVATARDIKLYRV